MRRRARLDGVARQHHAAGLVRVAALLGVARAFAGPALQALAPNLVPAAVLPTAIAMSSIAWQGGAIVGPPLGGFLYATGHFLPYAVSTGLFAAAPSAR